MKYCIVCSKPATDTFKTLDVCDGICGRRILKCVSYDTEMTMNMGDFHGPRQLVNERFLRFWDDFIDGRESTGFTVNLGTPLRGSYGVVFRLKGYDGTARLPDDPRIYFLQELKVDVNQLRYNGMFEHYVEGAMLQSNEMTRQFALDEETVFILIKKMMRTASFRETLETHGRQVDDDSIQAIAKKILQQKNDFFFAHMVAPCVIQGRYYALVDTGNEDTEEGVTDYADVLKRAGSPIQIYPKKLRQVLSRIIMRMAFGTPRYVDFRVCISHSQSRGYFFFLDGLAYGPMFVYANQMERLPPNWGMSPRLLVNHPYFSIRPFDPFTALYESVYQALVFRFTYKHGRKKFEAGLIGHAEFFYENDPAHDIRPVMSFFSRILGRKQSGDYADVASEWVLCTNQSAFYETPNSRDEMAFGFSSLITYRIEGEVKLSILSLPRREEPREEEEEWWVDESGVRRRAGDYPTPPPKHPRLYKGMPGYDSQ